MKEGIDLADYAKVISSVAALIFAGGTWFGSCKASQELAAHVIESKTVHTEEKIARESINSKLDMLIRFQESRR